MPTSALHAPAGVGSERSKVALADLLASRRKWLQEQELLLDVRREVVQVHDLRHARLSDVGEAGELQ